jgi:hypothetical protein
VLTQNCGDPFNSSMENKTTFINRIMSYYNGGCTSSENALGAKFIMLTMMNSRGSLDVNAWKAYINGSNLGVKWVSGATFDYNSGCYSNSGCGSGSGLDEYFINVSGTHDALVFYDKSSGTPIYQLKSNCGNPVGSTVGHIDTQWEVIPSASANRGTANVGDSVTWTYTVTVANHSINSSVVYGWKNTGGSNTSSGQQGTLGSGTGVGQGATFTKSYTVQAGDTGRSLCGVAYSNPGWSDNRVYRESAGDCVTINAPIVNPNACRPIANISADPKTYSAVSASPNNPSSYPAISARTISINVTTYNTYSGATQTIGSNVSSHTTYNVTSTHTTGDPYTVTFTETGSHVTSYTDHFTSGYESLYWGITKKGSVGPPKVADTYGWLSYSPKRWVTTSSGPHSYDGTSKYDYTTTNYNGPNSWAGTSFGPCYDYILNSSINDFFARLEPGASMATMVPTVGSLSYTQSADPSFYNLYHTHTKSKSTEWRITKMVIAPSATATPSTPPSAVAGGTTGAYGMSFCGRFDPTNKSTCSTFNGTTVFDVNGNPSSSINYNFTVPDIAAGTKICFAFSIYPSQSDSPNTSSSWGANVWNHATYDPARNCIVVVKNQRLKYGAVIYGLKAQSMPVIQLRAVIDLVAGMNTVF